MLQIDSQNALDATASITDHEAMIKQPAPLYIERIDHAKNMARFYAMSIMPTLFGDVCLIRRWGRIGSKGQEKQHHFEREEDAIELFHSLSKSKHKKGYCLLART